MRRFLRGLVRALLILFFLALAGFALLAWQVDRLGRVDEARPADAIVVLGARVNADGTPGSDLTSRTYHAVDLWMQGIAPSIICAGGFKDEPLSAASVCKRFAVSLGVPEERVLLADGSSNTIEDAAATAAVMSQRGMRSAVLVSHPLHLFRARWLFHRAGIDSVTSPTSTETHRIFPPLRAWYAVRE
ncbi:MAG: YdcF family protein, partial [Anaerolineae bacterium]|nr:YdcF family protein [Anaerolineae bacterium]